MVLPQVINLNRDKIIGFDSIDIISDADQIPLAESPHSLTSIPTLWTFWDLMDNSLLGYPTSVTLTYRSDVDGWFALMTEVAMASLVDRNKYFVKVSSTGPAGMRSFKILELSVENDSFEDTIMRLPYEVKVDGGECWILWYDDVSNFGTPSSVQFKAAAYQNGTGTTFATDPSKVTHRGPIIPA